MRFRLIEEIKNVVSALVIITPPAFLHFSKTASALKQVRIAKMLIASHMFNYISFWKLLLLIWNGTLRQKTFSLLFLIIKNICIKTAFLSCNIIWQSYFVTLNIEFLNSTRLRNWSFFFNQEMHLIDSYFLRLVDFIFDSII